MPNDLMESIEPYNYAEAVDFETAYLAGYLADKYDESAEAGLPRIHARVKKSVEQEFRNTINNFSVVTPKSSTVNVANGKVKYALLPVWLLNTTWKGQKYVFAMNGQTGKFVGNLPMDNSVFFKYLGIFVAAGTVASVLLGVIMNLV
jgi:hypothetical protein